MPSSEYPVYAGAVVRAPDGRILCQLRDNRPGIVCPGLWTCCPGGHVAAGELPREAILRELREEFEIEIEGLTPLLTHTEADSAYKGIYHAFYADLATPLENVACNEGLRAGFFPPEQAAGLPQHPVSLMILKHYMARGI